MISALWMDRVGKIVPAVRNLVAQTSRVQIFRSARKFLSFPNQFENTTHTRPPHMVGNLSNQFNGEDDHVEVSFELEKRKQPWIVLFLGLGGR
ncbi:hypothetical protein M8J76_011497 [Diaphorina citri]|nr:hypothetical protein M8J76_011497 [Diaphorina citri]KAI5734746.1 hypothetical protein M8J77_010066 [Diaphorina citri]